MHGRKINMIGTSGQQALAIGGLGLSLLSLGLGSRSPKSSNRRIRGHDGTHLNILGQDMIQTFPFSFPCRDGPV